MKSGKSLRTGVVITAILLAVAAGFMTWDYFDYRIPGIGKSIHDDPFAPRDEWPEPFESGKQKLRSLRRDLVSAKYHRFQKRTLSRLELAGTSWNFAKGHRMTGPGEGDAITFHSDGRATIKGRQFLTGFENEDVIEFERHSFDWLILKTGEDELRFELAARPITAEVLYDLMLYSPTEGEFIYLYPIEDDAVPIRP